MNEASESRPLHAGEHAPPVWMVSAYQCPHCGVLAQMDWQQMTLVNPPTPVHAMIRAASSKLWEVGCGNCRKQQYWIERDSPIMVYPRGAAGPRPHADMPGDAEADYEEARQIVQVSPRGACALLRLATEKLVRELQPTGGDLNDRIGKLVAKGLSPQVQRALDTLRVIGGEAVHPGELDLTDDQGTASGLFRCLNLIVEQLIAGPKHVEEMFGKLPDAKVAAIQRRDGGGAQ